MDAARIPDEEVVYRRVPFTPPWFENDAVTTANFKLDKRRGDLGISIYRKTVVTVDDVLSKPGAIPGSLVTQATVGAIRGLRNGKANS